MQRTAISIIEMPPERTWTWFDQYVADRSILLVWNRPFRSSEEMNRHQLARWLDRVGTNDTILGLGDVGRLDAWRGSHMVVDVRARPGQRAHLSNHDGDTDGLHHAEFTE